MWTSPPVLDCQLNEQRNQGKGMKWFYKLFWTQACPEGIVTNGTHRSTGNVIDERKRDLTSTPLRLKI